MVRGMISVFTFPVALVVTVTLGLYLVAVTFQLGCLVTDGLRVRAMPEPAILAALWQNIGLGCAILGLLSQNTQLAIFGGAFIALRMVLQPLDAPSWDDRAEKPLLIMAMISLGLLAMWRLVAYVIA